MKFLKIFSALLLFATMWTSCEDETDPKVPTDAVSPVLTAPTEGGTFVLQKVNESQVFQTFEWTNADFKMDVVGSYVLEVDAADGDFSGNKIISSNISSPFAVTVADFNKGLLAAGFEDGTAHNIKVRIKGGNYLVSEAIAMTVTPYFDAEPWTIIGSAVGGWDAASEKYMNYDKNTETYSLTLDLGVGEYKFRAPKKDASNAWKYNYGLSGESTNYENATNVALKLDGSNIKSLGGNYTITFDVNKETFSIVQNSASEMTNWTGVVLDAVGTGISADNAGASADASSWNWGNVIVADNSGIPSMNAAVYTWTWKGIVLEANEGFKIRTLNGVAPETNGALFDVGYSALDVSNSSSKVADLNGNLSVTAKGKFDITITIDATSGDAKKVTIKDPYPSALYMIGDGVGNWNWAETDLPMVPVNGTPSQFWKIVWMNGTGSFKFSPVKDWIGDFGGAEGSAGEGEFDFGSSNISVPSTAGYYMVVVDYSKNKVAVAPVKIYLIGDCVGSWDAGVAGNLFTLDNNNSVVTITKALSPGNIRMYAWHDWFSDWWRSEFNVFNGVIEPRGNGGDQTAVPLEAATYKIDLNFKTMAGSFTAQ